MTEYDHFREAEALLAVAVDARPHDAALLVARAQVHATLAAAAATRDHIAATIAILAEAADQHMEPATTWTTPSLGDGYEKRVQRVGDPITDDLYESGVYVEPTSREGI